MAAGRAGGASALQQAERAVTQLPDIELNPLAAHFVDDRVVRIQIDLRDIGADGLPFDRLVMAIGVLQREIVERDGGRLNLHVDLPGAKFSCTLA